MNKQQVAFIDDDPLFVDTLGRWQDSVGLKRRTTTSLEEAMAWVRSGEIATLVSGLRMGAGVDTLRFLAEARRTAGHLRLVLLTSFQPTDDERRRLGGLHVSVHYKDNLTSLLDELTNETHWAQMAGTEAVRPQSTREERRPEAPSVSLRSAFLSYGGPDESVAKALHESLLEAGVEVFFFPESAVPGTKLHRTMSEGIQSYDRVILLCSRSSLDRPGVLNELEQVLAREAAEGGAELLIPVALDDFVYEGWAPPRRDLARQVRSRVIGRIAAPNSRAFRTGVDRILKALAK